MKQRLGGVLAVALGAVLITSGIHGGSAGVGVIVVPPACGATVVGLPAPCPVGTITFSEVTTPVTAGPEEHSTRAAKDEDATPPAGGWQVTVTSSCLDPTTSAAVSQTVTVPNNGHATTDPLFIFTDVSSSTQCTYSFSQAAVAGFTTTYSPVSPVTIPDGGSAAPSNTNVTVTNSFVVTTTPTPTPTTTAPTMSTSASPSSMAPFAAGSLANTGPRTQVGASLYVGIGLVLLGLVMLFGGRLRRTGRRAS